MGFSIDVAEDGSHLRAASALEELGYSSLWLPGGQLDDLDRVRELVGATASVRVGTAIVPIGVYGTADVIRLHDDLAAAAPGRLELGLGGPQQPGSLGALRAYFDELDAAGVGPRERLLAALGPRKLALARERSAGAITLLVTPEFTARARATLGPDARMIVHLPVVLDTDAERARETARGLVGFLAGVPGYRANLVGMGLAETDIDGLGAGVIDAVVAWGDPGAILRRVDAHRAAGADEVVLSVHSGPGQPGGVDAARILAGSFADAV